MSQTETSLATLSEGEKFPSLIGRIAGILGAEEFPTGERAQLKRMTPDTPPPLAFYRLAYRYLPEGWERRWEAWMTLVAGLAIMGSGGHNPERRAGQVLAESNYSEKRLERLLAAEDETLHSLLLRAVRFLAAKGAVVNWLDFAYLLGLAGDPQYARMRIAQDYYRNLDQKKD
ncbi:MAG: type I-E CRISPR-associated protein Cse2/CasB [Myxococcales bacterium]|nr:type I-E CRISPR-associated protein Cse2/CasB [Myxococcota bacterium]MDW8284361.1 type I-E CRISPR-associated protein Cse2/CasB [Myxococcales bacterium]